MPGDSGSSAMIQNRKCLVLSVGGAVFVGIVASLMIGIGKVRFKTTDSPDAAVDTMGWEPELSALLKQPNAVGMDIARLNWLAGSGLSRSEELTLTNLVRELAAMTARVKAETARHGARFQRAPEEFNGSEAYFKMLCLVTVLQQDFGIRYSPQRAQPVEGRIEPNETFYAEAADVFLHELLGSDQGSIDRVISQTELNQQKDWVNERLEKFVKDNTFCPCASR